MFDWSSCQEKIGDSSVVTLNCIPVLIEGIIRAAITFIGVVSLAMIIFAGIRMLMAAGDAKQLDSAKKTITYALIGLVFVIFSFVIVNFIATATGVPCLKGIGIGNCQ